MPAIDTPLLIVGGGPAALVAAKVVSAAGVPCVVAGHEVIEDHDAVALDAASLAVLEPHGVLDVLRPYAAAQDPFTIEPSRFEAGLKHHCVADMLITVFDGISLADPHERHVDGRLTGVLSDGRSQWAIEADAYLDAAELATELNAAIHQAAAFAGALLDSHR